MREKSNENWSVGRYCLDNGHVNAAASRLYYAVFNAVLVWARAKKGYEGTGSSVHGDMYRLLRVEGKARFRYAPLLRDMRELREVADYQPDSPDVNDLQSMMKVCGEMREYYLKMADTP